MTTTAPVLRERIKCPHCTTRSIYVERVLTILDKDRNAITIEGGKVTVIVCGRCGSRYQP